MKTILFLTFISTFASAFAASDNTKTYNFLNALSGDYQSKLEGKIKFADGKVIDCSELTAIEVGSPQENFPPIESINFILRFQTEADMLFGFGYDASEEKMSLNGSKFDFRSASKHQFTTGSWSNLFGSTIKESSKTDLMIEKDVNGNLLSLKSRSEGKRSGESKTRTIVDCRKK